VNGLLTVGAVRAMRRPKLPVHFMPGYTDDVLPEDASPDIQLTLPHKPFTEDDLMDKLSKMLRVTATRVTPDV
jgi:hypothetical protein